VARALASEPPPIHQRAAPPNRGGIAALNGRAVAAQPLALVEADGLPVDLRGPGHPADVDAVRVDLTFPFSPLAASSIPLGWSRPQPRLESGDRNTHGRAGSPEPKPLHHLRHGQPLAAVVTGGQNSHATKDHRRALRVDHRAPDAMGPAASDLRPCMNANRPARSVTEGYAGLCGAGQLWAVLGSNQ
jgi:hypothetical protein